MTLLERMKYFFIRWIRACFADDRTAHLQNRQGDGRLTLEKDVHFIMKLNHETERMMAERFGKDSMIALATVDDGLPCVRAVNACYEDGAFYVITHALSNKMRQLARNPAVAIAGERFTARGTGVSLGYIEREENRRIADRLKEAFASWLGSGHVDLEDENTVLLCIRLESGTLFSTGTRYDIEF